MENETMIIEQEFAKIPQNMGDYDELVQQGVISFGVKERVNRYGCEFESIVENNTYAPATLVNGKVTPDTTHWRLVTGIPGNYGLDGKMAEMREELDTEKQKTATLEEAVGTGGSVDSRISAAVATETTRAQGVEEQLRQAYEALSQSQPIPVTSLPATGEAGKIYRLAGTNSYADYMYAEGALTTPIKMAEYDNAIDDEPTAGSDNLVKSGSVYSTQKTSMCNLLDLEHGIKYNQLLIHRAQYISFTANPQKKDIRSNGDLSYVEIPVEFIGNKIIVDGINYTPSIGDPSQYLRILFFDENDNLLSETATLTSKRTLELDKPNNATQCYIDVPTAHIDEHTIKTSYSGDLQDQVNYLKSIVNDIRNGIRIGNLRNGGVLNYYNGYKVSTNCIDVRNIDKIKLYTDRPADTDTFYQLAAILTSSENAIGNFFAYNYNPNNYSLDITYTNLSLSSIITIPNNIVGIIFEIFEIPLNGSEGDVVLRTNDFSLHETGIIGDKNIDNIYNEIIEINGKIEELEDVNAYTRNKQKTIALGAACRQRIKSETSKDFQALIVTDSHYDYTAVTNGSIMANDFKTVDIVLQCGDVADYMTPNDNKTDFIAEMNKCIKPWYNVIGNHEAGTYNAVGYAPSVQHMYDVFISPMVDKGFIVTGEYEVGKCHYYHDFTEYNIRLIVINEYDGDFALDDTYWEAVPYDELAPEINWYNTYQADTVLKMKNGYTDYCFKAKQSITMPPSLYELNGQQPKYKSLPGFRVISQSQAQWFLNTLASTPANYSVIIAMHSAFSNIARTQPSLKFSQSDINITAQSGAMNNIVTDFFADAVDAFVNGSLYSTKIVFGGDASYRNVLNDGIINYAYEVSKDFSQKNTGVKFMCFIGGHYHKDLIWKHPTYNYQYQVTPVCASTSYPQSPTSDIRRSKTNGIDYDSITSISFDTDNGAIRLVKIGVDVTSEMEHRDFEKISFT